MTDDEFEAFLVMVTDELLLKQAELNRIYALGEMARWWFEQGTGTVQFFDNSDRLVVEAEVVSIGSFSVKTCSWKWAWSNPSIEPALRQAALPLKQLQAITGLDLFGNEHAFSIQDETMAWELAASAVHYLKAAGCYRAPTSSEGPNTYLAITSIKVLGD
ncbi:hypothetical protein NUH87_06290 [Pseudomonas batumici]|uniref:DUF6882 domain-containing protein n=1 Tax=Pseudomonas batumici TaxID=226910 RepID=UPI0030D176F7